MKTMDLVATYRTMATYRRFEEAVGEAVVTGEVHGEMHLGIGQEAIAVALECLLGPDDAVVSTHRPHLHALALGVDPVDMLAELLERSGVSGGKGGHMHLFSRDPQFMCTGIVGASAPLACGYALAQRQGDPGRLTVAVAGDGSMNQGAVFESMNLAALWRLPVVFLCEDNGYGISVRRDVASAGRLADRGTSFGIPGQECDGTDPQSVHAALEPAFERARSGQGPSVVVATCYRFRGHYEGDADTYRSKGERDDWMSAPRDPLTKLRAQLETTGTPVADLDAADAAAEAQVAAWIEAARAVPFPDVGRVREDVFAAGALEDVRA